LDTKAFPQPMLPPFVSGTDTGTSNPTMPTIRITAPIISANRRTVTPCSFARCPGRDATCRTCFICSIGAESGAGRDGAVPCERIRLSHRRDPGWAIPVALIRATHPRDDSMFAAVACSRRQNLEVF
jgi:hypothetical protein